MCMSVLFKTKYSYWYFMYPHWHTKAQAPASTPAMGYPRDNCDNRKKSSMFMSLHESYARHLASDLLSKFIACLIGSTKSRSIRTCNSEEYLIDKWRQDGSCWYTKCECVVTDRAYIGNISKARRRTNS